MSDIYVFSASEENNDYSTMGLVGALTPTECKFQETANGESIVTLDHPLDEFGRYLALERENILVVPVPIRTTPEIQNGKCVTTVWTYKIKPLAQLTSTSQRKLYKKKTGSSSKKTMPAGTSLTVVQKSEDASARWKVKCKYGTGWVNTSGLDLVTEHKIEDNSEAIQEIQSPWTVTDQYFRIFEVDKSLDGVQVSARHISYDLLYNMTRYNTEKSVKLQAALDGVLNGCYAEHEFAAYTNVSNAQTGLFYKQRNVIDAFLDPEEGLCARYDVGIVRDNYDLYFLHDPGINRGVRIEYGKNMLGISFKTSDDEVATRIVPMGETKDGSDLFLSSDESKQYVDSAHINDYPVIHVYAIKCENCKVGDTDTDGSKITTAIARARMRAQAEELLANGCDMPNVEMSVEFINLGDTTEYAQFKNLENSFLYDYIIVQHPRLNIDVTAQIVSITWDCLLDRMESVDIGSVGKTLANTGITSWQIPAGFSGSKIRDNSVGNAALRSDIISVRHVQADSINTDALQAQSVTTDKLAAGSITADVIDVITMNAWAANIANAAIENATIEVAQIQNLQAEVARIANLVVQNAEIDIAQIKNLQAEIARIAQAEIGRAEIDVAQIMNLQAYVATIADAAIENANIMTAQIVNFTAAVGEIADAAIDNATITTAQIADLQVYVANIASLTVSDARISYAHIYDLVADTAIIEQGVGDKLIIRRLNVTEANMVNLTVGELVVKGEDGLFYRFEVDSNGILQTYVVDVEGDNIANNTIGGSKIIENSITARELNVAQIFANEALIGIITAGNISAGAIEFGHMAGSTITALGNALNLSANESISLVVSDAIAAAQREFVGQQVRLTFSNGTYLSEDTTETDVFAQVYVNGQNVTGDIDKSCFVWERISEDAVGDAAWNAAHRGKKQFTLTTDDINLTAVIRCYIDLNPTYPAFAVLNGALLWTQAAADIGDEFWLEDGILMSNSDNYEMDEGGTVYALKSLITAIPTEVTVVDHTDDPVDRRLAAEIRLTQEEILLKASKEELDDLGDVVDRANAEISIMAGEISQKVEQTEFDDLGRVVDQQSAALSLIPGEIEMAVRNIQVGGTQIIENSTGDFGAWSGNDTVTDGVADHKALDIQRSGYSGSDRKITTKNVTLPTYDQNEEYTLSGWLYVFSDIALSSSNNVIFVRCYDANNAFVDICSYAFTPTINKGKWIYFSATGKLPASRTRIQASIALDRNGHFKVSCLKLERGNKATGWSAHPFDPVQYVTAGKFNVTPQAVTFEQFLNGSAIPSIFRMTASEFGLFLKATGKAFVKAGITSDGAGFLAVNRLQDPSDLESMYVMVEASTFATWEASGALAFWTKFGRAGKIIATKNTQGSGFTILELIAEGTNGEIGLEAKNINVGGNLLTSGTGKTIGALQQRWGNAYLTGAHFPAFNGVNFEGLNGKICTIRTGGTDSKELYIVVDGVVALSIDIATKQVTLNKPLPIGSGGHNANNVLDAQRNLGITRGVASMTNAGNRTVMLYVGYGNKIYTTKPTVTITPGVDGWSGTTSAVNHFFAVENDTITTEGFYIRWTSAIGSSRDAKIQWIAVGN